MIAKCFVLFTVLAFAFAQKSEKDFQYDVQKALHRLQGLNAGAEKGLKSAFEEVSINKKYLIMKPDDFLEKSKYVREQTRQIILRVALELENKAEDLKKPQSTFRCIEKAEKDGLAKVDASAPLFESEIKEIQATASSTIAIVSKPLPKMKNDFSHMYQHSVKQVKSCTTSDCLRTTMIKIRQQYDGLHSKIRRIFVSVETAFASFMKDAFADFGNYRGRVNKILEDTVQAMKKCMT